MLKQKPVRKESIISRILNAIKPTRVQEHKEKHQMEEKVTELISQEKVEMLEKDIENVIMHLKNFANENGRNKEDGCVHAIDKKQVLCKWNADITNIMTDNVLNTPITIRKNHEENQNMLNSVNRLYEKIADVILSTVCKIKANDLQQISKLLENHIGRTKNTRNWKAFNDVTPEMPNWALKGYLKNDYRSKPTKIVSNLVDKMADYIIEEKGEVTLNDVEEFFAQLIKRGQCMVGTNIINRNLEYKSPNTKQNIISTIGTDQLSPQQARDTLETSSLEIPNKLTNVNNLLDDEPIFNKFNIGSTTSIKRKCMNEAIEKGIKTLEYIKGISEQLFIPEKNFVKLSDSHESTLNAFKITTNSLGDKNKHKKDLETQTSFLMDNPKTATNGKRVTPDATVKLVKVDQSTEEKFARIPSLITTHDKLPINKNYLKSPPIRNINSRFSKTNNNLNSQLSYNKLSKKILTLQPSATALLSETGNNKSPSNHNKPVELTAIKDVNRRLSSANHNISVKSSINSIRTQNIKPASQLIYQQPKIIPSFKNVNAIQPQKCFRKSSLGSQINKNSSDTSQHESVTNLVKTNNRPKTRSERQRTIVIDKESLHAPVITNNKLIENTNFKYSKQRLSTNIYEKNKYLTPNKSTTKTPTLAKEKPTESNEILEYKKVKQPMLNYSNQSINQSIYNKQININTKIRQWFLKTNKTYAVFKPLPIRRPVSTTESKNQIENCGNTENDSLIAQLETESSSNVQEVVPLNCRRSRPPSQCPIFLSKIPTIQRNNNNNNNKRTNLVVMNQTSTFATYRG